VSLGKLGLKSFIHFQEGDFGKVRPLSPGKIGLKSFIHFQEGNLGKVRHCHRLKSFVHFQTVLEERRAT
jgi:hypothetical protein